MSTNKLCCAKCGNPFPSDLEFFMVTDKSTKELICHPCNYVRIGVNPYEEHQKQVAQRRIEIEKRKQENEKIAQQKEQAKKDKEEKLRKSIKTEQRKNKQEKLF